MLDLLLRVGLFLIGWTAAWVVLMVSYCGWSAWRNS